MRPVAHIHLQSIAVFFIIYLMLFFTLKEGLDYTYGESQFWFILVMPPAYFVAKRAMEWYQRRAVKKYNQRLEQGRPG